MPMAAREESGLSSKSLVMQVALREDRTSEKSFGKKSRKQVARWENRALMKSFAKKAATVTAARGVCPSDCRPPVEKTTCRESRLFKQVAHGVGFSACSRTWLHPRMSAL